MPLLPEPGSTAPRGADEPGSPSPSGFGVIQAELSPAAGVIGIATLLDEAHAMLTTEPLAELLLGVRRSLDGAAGGSIPAGTNAWISTQRPGLSQAAKVYLRPIELLVYAADDGSPLLSQSQIRQIDAYLDEIAARPNGARLTPIVSA